MKSLIMTATLLITIVGQTYANDCRDVYQERVEQVVNKRGLNPDGMAIWGGVIAYGATGVAGIGFLGGAFAGLFPGFLKYFKTAPDRKMIKLINQSIDYSEDQNIRPGKHLKKLHKRFNDPNLSMLDLAIKIVDGNEDLSLCPDDADFRNMDTVIDLDIDQK